MADTKISNLTALAAAPDSGDFFALVDTSAAETKKLDAKYLVRDSAGSGAIVTGAYTLTIPATGTAALLGTAQTFTANQRVSALLGVGVAPTTGQQLIVLAGSTSTVGLVVDTPASPTANIAEFRNNGTAKGSIDANGRVVAQSFLYATPTINDDAVYTITPLSGMATLLISPRGSAYPTVGGIVAVRALATSFSTILTQFASVLATSTSILTGTTGTDGKVTISGNDNGNIYIENRYGSAISLSIVVLGG